MELNKVNSSNIDSAGYDPEKEILIILFKSGSYYQYDDVPEQVYKNMMNSSSKGQYFNSYIKKVYRFKKINVQQEDMTG